MKNYIYLDKYEKKQQYQLDGTQLRPQREITIHQLEQLKLKKIVTMPNSGEEVQGRDHSLRVGGNVKPHKRSETT